MACSGGCVDWSSVWKNECLTRVAQKAYRWFSYLWFLLQCVWKWYHFGCLFRWLFRPGEAPAQKISPAARFRAQGLPRSSMRHHKLQNKIKLRCPRAPEWIPIDSKWWTGGSLFRDGRHLDFEWSYNVLPWLSVFCVNVSRIPNKFYKTTTCKAHAEKKPLETLFPSLGKKESTHLAQSYVWTWLFPEMFSGPMVATAMFRRLNVYNVDGNNDPTETRFETILTQTLGVLVSGPPGFAKRIEYIYIYIFSTHNIRTKVWLWITAGSSLSR